MALPNDLHDWLASSLDTIYNVTLVKEPRIDATQLLTHMVCFGNASYGHDLTARLVYDTATGEIKKLLYNGAWLEREIMVFKSFADFMGQHMTEIYPPSFEGLSKWKLKDELIFA
jgi:hypothetical protein